MEIQLPNGQVAEFPDTMSHSEIEAVLRKQFPIQPQGMSNIPSDIGNAGLNLLLGAGNKVMQLPQEISDAAKQLYQTPLSGTGRAGLGIMSGLLEGGKQLYNTPLEIMSYLGSVGIPPYKQLMGVAEKAKIGDTGLQKKVMGEPQKGDALWQDIGEFAPMAVAPERLGLEIPAITSKGIMKRLSKEKALREGVAGEEYGKLFKDARDKNIDFAVPGMIGLQDITSNVVKIVEDSHPRYHESLMNYLHYPSLKNAHDAQSDLGALQRSMDKVYRRTGFTKDQAKTYKSVLEAREGIRDAMFSENVLGKSPELGARYNELSDKYRDEVVPFKTLEDLHEFEAGKLRPKTAVKNLLNDEEFMLNLAKRFPGVYLHTPLAKNIGLGAAGLLGLTEMKNLLSK